MSHGLGNDSEQILHVAVVLRMSSFIVWNSLWQLFFSFFWGERLFACCTCCTLAPKGVLVLSFFMINATRFNILHLIKWHYTVSGNIPFGATDGPAHVLVLVELYTLWLCVDFQPLWDGSVHMDTVMNEIYALWEAINQYLLLSLSLSLSCSRRAVRWKSHG